MIEEYRENIKRAYILHGKAAEKDNENYIDWLVEKKRITSDQREHLQKYNKNLSKALK